MWYEIEEVSENMLKEDEFWACHLSPNNRNNTKKARGIPPPSFQTRCLDENRGLTLFGTVPPPKNLDLQKVESIAKAVAQSINELKPDGVVVYDIQDEPSRNGSERPFPFLATHDPAFYSKLINDFTGSESEPITFRAMISGETNEDFIHWLKKTKEEYGIKNLVLVGGCRQGNEKLLTVPEAQIIINQHFPSDFFLGGITIPERHRDKLNEHTRLLEKSELGIHFFTSQVIYNADNAIWMLQDYEQLCKSRGKRPARIVFTFAPFGSENTCNFLEWLGVEIPVGTKKRVLSRGNLKACIEESLQICWENFKRILDACQRLKISVPLGFSVESVSKSRMEQQGACKLFVALKEQLDAYYLQKKY